MAVVGYDDEGIDIRNSWGPRWGDAGHCKMPWRDAYDDTSMFCTWEKPGPGGVGNKNRIVFFIIRFKPF